MSRNKPLPSLDFLEPRVKIARFLATAGYLGVLLTITIYNGFFADLHGANPLVIVGVQLVPLLIFLPGVLLGWPRVYAFLCFVINLYFILGVLVCLQPEREVYGGLLVAFTLLYFIAALGFIRWTFQAQRVRAGEV